MGIKQQTTESFKEKVYKRYGDQVEILSEYNGGTEPIDFIYRCEIHGETKKTLNAKNVLASHFSPCKQCTSNSHSDSRKKRLKKDPDYFYERFKNYCKSRGGTLVSEKWVTAKTTYEVDCGNVEHPNFFSTADSLENSNGWCPYCYGRKGNFDEDLKLVVESKNGEIVSKYEKSMKHVLVKCKIHNYIWSMTPTNIKKGRWCPICSLPYSEKVVYDYLINNQHVINIQHGFEDLKGENNELLRFDFSIFNRNGNLIGLLEIDDDEHRQNHIQPRRVRARERDVKKDTYCKDNNIKLFRLAYYNKRKQFRNYDWYYEYIVENLKEFLTGILK